MPASCRAAVSLQLLKTYYRREAMRRKIAEWAAGVFLVGLSIYFLVALSPLLIVGLLLALLLTWRSWLLHPVETWQQVKEGLRKTFRPTAEEAERQRLSDEIRRKADELANWESQGAVDCKTRPVREWQPPHVATCRCELCTAYWRGWRSQA